MRQRGFTLIELMVTVSVLAVLLGVAAPSFNSFIEGQKVKTVSFDLMSGLAQARSEAVKRNTAVTVAPDVADAWAGGWTVKYAAVTVLQQTAVTGLTLTGPANVVYGPNGRPAATSSFQLTGSSATRCVKVDASGIASAKSGAC